MSGDYWSVINHRLLMIDEIMMMPFLHQTNTLKWISTALLTHDPDSVFGSLFILLNAAEKQQIPIKQSLMSPD
jgi:hypothetical protein